jgi:hypothetical protein
MVASVSYAPSAFSARGSQRQTPRMLIRRSGSFPVRGASRAVFYARAIAAILAIPLAILIAAGNREPQEH